MKYITIIFFLIAVILVGAGAYYDLMDMDITVKDKFYGFGCVCLFFLAMPSFLFYRRNKTDIRKYMLNPEQNKKDETENPNKN